ncbi:MAG: hypothetical protein O3B01_01845 [Planctomycetota bacterium]|nr:hypothetical protein [Planctomycetota bacterium]MDA1137299.1 hypothetical protein [Planctomycetota bacterium]
MQTQDYVKKTETINGRNIAFISYKVGDQYYCKAEIDIPGAGARLTSAKGPDRAAIEKDVRGQVVGMVTT